MRKLFSLILYCLFFISMSAQYFGKNTWIEVTHTVNQLAFVDISYRNILDSILFDQKKNLELKQFVYFHMYLKTDVNCQIIEFRLSNYPYQSENLIGFFILRDFLIFVHDKLPDFLIYTEYKKDFSYTEWKIGNLVMREDDTLCWIVEYCNNSFNVLYSP